MGGHKLRSLRKNAFKKRKRLQLFPDREMLRLVSFSGWSHPHLSGREFALRPDWNAAYYARRFGFAIVPEAECGLEMKRILESERAVLPHPEYRTAMVRKTA